MSEVVLVPGMHPWLLLSESGKINVLTMMHNIRVFVTINMRAFWRFSPLEIKP